MSWLSLVQVVLVISGVVSAILAWYAWRQRATSGAAYFSIMMIAVAFYAFTVSLELASSTIAARIFWSKVQYFSTATLGVFWFLFSLHYGQPERRVSRRAVALLWAVPVIVLILAWTNEWHGLVWTDVYHETGRFGEMTVYEHGPGFWGHVVFSYALLVSGAGILLSRAYRSARFYRGQIAVLFVAILMPLSGNLLYITGIWRGFDLAPLIFTLSTGLLAWAVFRFHLLKVLPIAHDAIVSGMREGVILIDIHGRLAEVNEAAESMLALSPDLIGLPVASILAPWPQLATLEDGVIEFERTPESSDVSAWRCYEASATPLRDYRGHFAGRLLLIRDITERKRAEEAKRRLDVQLLQSEKMESLGVLAGGIAHDFNNMFMIIHGSVELALLRLPQQDPLRETLETVKETVLRAAELSRQMLAYAGKGFVDAVPIDMSEMLSEMAPMMRVSVPDAISLRYELAPDLPSVRADVAQLRQVVMALVRNAAEAIGDSGGTIMVRTALADGELPGVAMPGADAPIPGGRFAMLEVMDNGPGMDASILPKVFEPFFTTKFIGRGLGLAAASGVIRGHGGTITVESAPGEGATFRFFLPA